MATHSVLLESLILFYINMKHSLQTKVLNQSGFIDQMIKYCEEKGFQNYSHQVLRNVWTKLITKYQSLKCTGTTEEKENWKYFNILDSCYEESDFSNNKFSDDIVWLMIECFLKMRRSEKPQKHDTIFTEVHKEFLTCGYIHISKRYLKDKWKYLNFKCNELKNNSKMQTKVPYLEAIKALQEGRCVVNMAFTRDLTEQLIKYFTELKIACIIHGYNSEKVLSDIQFKFKDQEVSISKEDIKEKWQKLTNIYKFVADKGKSQTTWIHFDSMKKHFEHDFLCSSIKANNNEHIEEQDDGKKKCLRPRSKSVGPEILRLSSENTHVNKNKSIKRSLDNHGKTKSRKKIKIEDLVVEVDPYEVTENPFMNDVPNIAQAHLNNSSTSNSSTNKVHIINIDESEIDRRSGNITINIPSITKEFSDNEFLPLKKRLRINADIDNPPGSLKKIDGSHETEQCEDQKPVNDTTEDTPIVEKEIARTLEIIDSGKPEDKVSIKNSPDHLVLEELNKNFTHQCHVKLSENGFQENTALQKLVSPNSLKKPPVVFLVIKMDGTKSFLKNSTLNRVGVKIDEISNTKTDSSLDIKQLNADSCSKQELRGPLSVSNGFMKPISMKSMSEACNKWKDMNHMKNQVHTISTNEILDSFNGAISEFNPTKDEQVADLNNSNLRDNHTENENVPLFTETETEKCDTENHLVIETELKNIINSECDITTPDVSRKLVGTNTPVKPHWPGFKFTSQVIKGPVIVNPIDKSIPMASSSKNGLKSFGNHSLSASCGRNEDFDSESVFSEAVGEDDGLKDNLLATVIDFQEQNNNEFVEIKNLMKQNNLLQRETNRLLRLLLEHM